MAVALGGTDLGVPEQPSDHFQRRLAKDQQGCKRVAQVMDAGVGIGERNIVAQGVRTNTKCQMSCEGFGQFIENE